MKTEIDRASIFGPDRWQGQPELAADIIIRILSANYGSHNITNNSEKLAIDIKEGNLLPWITRDETACAALIRQGDTDVEIGRAACVPKLAGGKSAPIVAAVARWQEAEVFPKSQILRAEIRTAKPTIEVPGGQATQAIFLRNLGFAPTAMGPFFHHGFPDRQEMFILANIIKDKEGFMNMAKSLSLPNNIFSSREEKEMFQRFWKSNFSSELPLVNTDIHSTCHFSVKDVGPFIVLEPNQEQGGDWQTLITNHFKSGHRFALARLNLNNQNLPQLAKGVTDLRNAGFRLLGFEPVLTGDKWSMDLLMGRLSLVGRSNLVMPSFSEGVVSHETEDNLLQVSIKWRKND